MSTSTFPDRLKLSEVKPLFKKVKKINPSNYRPISLLTSFSKIFEKIIYSRLYKHINKMKSWQGNSLVFDKNLQWN